LFFAIPEELRIEGFENGILFLVIIGTSVIMAWALIATRNQKAKRDGEESPGQSASTFAELPIDEE
jgi:hypothetical protein